jgi:hypothetical protein
MKHLVFILIFSMAVVAGTAQQVIATNGDTKIVEGIEVSWTMGEAIVETLSGNTAILTQGFHQPGFSVKSVTEPILSELKITLYPNPTRDILSMQFSQYVEGLQYILYDMTGRVLEYQWILSTDVRISLRHYSKGTYILKVTDTSLQDIQTFKVVRY